MKPKVIKTVADLLTYTSKHLLERDRYETSKTTQNVMNSLMKFVRHTDLSLSDITPSFLKSYEKYLLLNGHNWNTISLYMRTLRSACNRAKERRLVKLSDTLFNDVFTGYVPSYKRSVPIDVIGRVRRAVLDGKNKRLAFARDLFMLSFYLRGIPFVDLAHLRKEDIRDGVLHYRRRKTGKVLAVYIEPCARDIIDRYISQTSGSPYLLPIIHRYGDVDVFRQYESALRLYNKHLQTLADYLNLGVKLTSYVPRHSWANIAHENGVSIADISASLSHSSEKVTKEYLQEFTADRLADVNHFVIGIIKGMYKNGIPIGTIEGYKRYSGSL